MSKLTLYDRREVGIFKSDAWLDDGERVHARWEDDISRLFVNDEASVEITVNDDGSHYRIARARDELAKVLDHDYNSIRTVVIPQQFSWGYLQASPSCISELLRRLRPFPALADVFHAFGVRVMPSNETLGSYCSRTDRQSTRTERCYILKCVEKKHLTSDANPWSPRQFGVYEQQDLTKGRSTFIVLNHSACRMLRNRLLQLQDPGGQSPSRGLMHAMMVAASCSNWTEFVSFLETDLLDVSLKVSSASSEADDGIQLQLADLQQLQDLQSQLQRALQQLEINIEVATAVEQDFLSSNPFSEPQREHGQESQAIRSSICDLLAQTRRIRSLLARAADMSTFTQSLLSNMSLQALSRNGKVTTRLAQLAKDDNKLMVQLSAESRNDSRTLKTITILTLAYLPVSFVSTLMSMDYITIDYDNGHGNLRFRSEMWIFLFLSTLLLSITFGSWLMFDLRRKRLEARRRRHELTSSIYPGLQEKFAHPERTFTGIM